MRELGVSEEAVEKIMMENGKDIASLNILLGSEGKDYLSELYGKVIENVQKTLVSSGMKNTEPSGDPVSRGRPDRGERGKVALPRQRRTGQPYLRAAVLCFPGEGCVRRQSQKGGVRGGGGIMPG